MASPGEYRPPIHHLPQEILVCIFLLYIPAPRQHSGFKFKPRPHALQASRWSSLMLVCRHWRDVALASPTLWQAVDVKKTAAWLELAVERSCGAVLDLCFHERDVTLESIPLITAQAHRIRTLRLPRFKRIDLPAVQTLLRTAMLVLQELRVHLERSYTDKTTSTPIRITSDFIASFPLLSSARFEYMAVPWPPLSLSRMRSLTLRDCKVLNRKLKFDRFLDVLEGCTELVGLRLHRFLSTFSHRVPADFSRTVVLPRLKQLTVREVPSLCRQLLSAVELPPTIALRVFGIIDAEGYDEAISKFCLWSDQAPIYYRPSAGSVMLTLDWDRDEMGGYTMGALEDFTVLFAKMPLEIVDIGCSPGTVPISVVWSAMFAAFRSIHTLTMLPGQAVQPVWSALAGKHMPLLEVDEDAAREFCPVLLPKLRKLRMEYLEWGEEAMGYILESLRRRAMRGLPKLEELTVFFFEGVDSSDGRIKEEICRALPFYEENVAAFATKFEWGSI